MLTTRPGSDLDRTQPVVIRTAESHDKPQLQRLAHLDSAPPLRGDVLVAQVGKVIVAAIGLESPEEIADPFRRTAAIMPMLRLRRNQLAGGALAPASPSPLLTRLRALRAPLAGVEVR